jgi:cobalt/nickel transport system ATP-binding protein
MEPEYILETKDLCYRYEGSRSLSMDHVGIKIKKGVKTILLGANGAGKSTLFFHFNGVFKPDSGKVLYNGREIEYKKKALAALRSEISVVLQNPDDQIFSATVEEDVAFGPMNLDLPMEEVEERVNEALFQVGLLDIRDRPTAQLSYGQRKRVAFAGALAMKSKVLILDEPTAGLDPQMSQEVMELAEQLHHAGTTVVISTHDVDLAYAWADEIHVLRRGNLVYSGESEGFYTDPTEVHLAGLMPPSMFAINENLESIRGKSDKSPYPRTMTQLLCKMDHADVRPGTLICVPVGKSAEAGAIGRLSDSNPELRIGVYGTDARRSAYADRARVDFVFNALESCLMECIIGRDAVLLHDDNITDLIGRTAAELKLFGTDIRVEVKTLGGE